MKITRLSIPGNACVHCGTIITEKLQCSGCGWVDPLTKELESKMTEVEKEISDEELRIIREQQHRDGHNM